MSPAEQHLLDAVLAALEAPGAEHARRRLAEILGPHLTTPGVEEDEWMDAKAAAKHLGITPAALYKATAARAPGLEFSQEGPGAKCFFQRSALNAYRQQHLQGHRDA